MEARIRSQPKQDRYKIANYSDLPNKWAKDRSDFDYCWVFKYIILLIGLFSIVISVYLNAWLSIENPQVKYRVKNINIEENISYSDFINYAADYNGAKVIAYEPFTKKVFNFGVKSSENVAEKAISSDNSKGNCWGFDGAKGSILIKLQQPIFPKHFTFKHANLANFDSAPKRICVNRGSDLLGCYEFYIAKGTPSPEFSQTFPCMQNCNKQTSEFSFVINSNHGGDFTCVYQILIHGDPITLTL
jgi:Sad1 / UNC-like C-terminal